MEIKEIVEMGGRRETREKKEKGSIHVPSDLFIRIMSMLPVKSLMRFKCICRAWNELTKNPDFIALHLNRCTSNKEKAIFLCCYQRRSGKLLLSKVSSARGALEVIGEFPFLNRKWPDRVLFSGPCNGILCLHYGSPFAYSSGDDGRNSIDNNIALWNPSTKEFSVLPPSPIPLPQSPPQAASRLIGVTVGLGFDHRANDYKVVKISFIVHVDYDIVPHMYKQVEVYSLNTNSWRLNIASLPTCYIRTLGDSSSYLNGYLYWLSPYGVISFDVCDEVFETIPNPIDYPQSNRKKLVVWHDSIAVISIFDPVISPRHGWRTYFEVWVLSNDSDGTKSWMKQPTIALPPPYRILVPNIDSDRLQFLLSDHTLARYATTFVGDIKLELYDLRTHQVKTLDSPCGEMALVGVYGESLVSVKGKQFQRPSLADRLYLGFTRLANMPYLLRSCGA